MNRVFSIFITAKRKAFIVIVVIHVVVIVCPKRCIAVENILLNQSVFSVHPEVLLSSIFSSGKTDQI